MSDIAIKVDAVSKDFKIAHERSETLKAHFTAILKGKKNRTIETQHALKNISFEIKKGEFFGIVGRNGSGKSTLLKILAGIYQPNKGSVSVTGKLVPFIELGVGFNPELTGRENIYMNGALLNFTEKEVNEFYDEVVEFAELEQFMDKKLKNYSSGMQVRLAFSMAIRAKADILLIDEVLAVGDADFQRKCFEYFDYLKKTETTVVFVSHDMEAVRKYCEKAVLIEDGQLAATGKANEIAKAYIRQFNVNKNVFVLSEQNRWGDGAVVFEDIIVDIKKNTINIKQDIIAKSDTDDYIVGIRLKNSAGQHVAGTNTNLEHLNLKSLKAGDRISLHWTLPNILSDGNYYLDPAIVYGDGVTVSDWWDEAVRFTIKKDRVLPYPVDPDIKVKVL